MRSIGPLGVAARVVAGVVLLALGVAGGHWIAWWQLAVGLAALPAALMLAQLARLVFTKSPLRQTDHLTTCINCAVIIGLLVASPTRNATLVFLGASMLVAALRGYSGCESLAISNWLLGRDDQAGCMLFSPLDGFEASRIK